MANLKDIRIEILDSDIRAIADGIVIGLLQKMREKGSGSFVHRHEIMGCMQEEWHELIEASHSRDLHRLESELYDVAMAAVFSIASLTFLDPTRR